MESYLIQWHKQDWLDWVSFAWMGRTCICSLLAGQVHFCCFRRQLNLAEQWRWKGNRLSPYWRLKLCPRRSRRKKYISLSIPLKTKPFNNDFCKITRHRCFYLAVGICKEIWNYIIIGTGNNRRLLNISKLSHILYENMCEAQLGFQSFTGCDTTSSLPKEGKLGHCYCCKLSPSQEIFADVVFFQCQITCTKILQ